MRKALLMAGALLALTAATAMAQVNLSWDTCAENGAVVNKAVLCTSNTGGNTMVASWIPPTSATLVTGLEVYLNYQVNAAALPCWWNFAQGALPPTGRASGQLVGTSDGTDLYLCGGGSGNYFRDNAGPAAGSWVQTAANKGAWRFAIAAGGAGDPEDVEQFGLSVRIQNTATLGGTCPGCLTEACFVFSRAVVTQLGVPNIEMTNPGVQQHVTWRSSTGVPCPAATPAKKATWGSIKALYR